MKEMIFKSKNSLGLTTTLLCLLSLTGLAACSPSPGATGKLRVVTTVGMIADIAENIGGDRVEVHALMGPGVDPHLYKARAGDVQRLSSADLILYGGLHLESKMGEVLEEMSRGKKIRAVSEAIPEERLLAVDPEGKNHDPHVWFDVALWRIAARAAAEALIDADPAGGAAYEARAVIYDKALEELDHYVRQKAASIPEGRRYLITAHDAFNYFGRAYGFTVMGIQGISTVTEAGTGDIRELADLIAEKKIPAIFVESSVPPKTIEALQAAVASRGFSVSVGGSLFSDAMGTAGTPDGTYAGMVRHNIDTIATALGAVVP